MKPWKNLRAVQKATGVLIPQMFNLGSFLIQACELKLNYIFLFGK